MAVVNRRLLQPGERIRVMVVDDSVVIRRLVTQALERDPLIEVVGTASNGAIGLQRIPQYSPDVMTLDIEMPDMNGLEMLRRVRREYPQMRHISRPSLERTVLLPQVGHGLWDGRPTTGHGSGIADSFGSREDTVPAAAVSFWRLTTVRPVLPQARGFLAAPRPG